MTSRYIQTDISPGAEPRGRAVAGFAHSLIVDETRYAGGVAEALWVHSHETAGAVYRDWSGLCRDLAVARKHR